MADNFEERKEKIVSECVKRGASERNITPQYQRFLKIPIKAAQNIVETRKENEEAWRNNTVPSYLIIEHTKESYMKYMKDNVILLDVLRDSAPDSPLCKDWESAKAIITEDLAKNSK